MKCDLCDNSATVHEVTISGGKKLDRHLCEQCARAQGIAIAPQQPVAQVLAQIMAQAKAGGASEQPAPDAACDACGLSFAQFRQGGQLGCPRCYEAFVDQLGPLLQRAHEGAIHHRGKLPRRLGEGVPEPAVSPERIGAMRKQLADAIAAEEYERAARLRDELRRAGAADRPHGGPRG